MPSFPLYPVHPFTHHAYCFTGVPDSRAARGVIENNKIRVLSGGPLLRRVLFMQADIYSFERRPVIGTFTGDCNNFAKFFQFLNKDPLVLG
jgi:hypothetical protein